MREYNPRTRIVLCELTLRSYSSYIYHRQNVIILLLLLLKQNICIFFSLAVTGTLCEEKTPHTIIILTDALFHKKRKKYIKMV